MGVDCREGQNQMGEILVFTAYHLTVFWSLVRLLTLG